MSDVAVAVDADVARRLTERIRLMAQNVADNVQKLRDLVEEARSTNVHETLGYASWTAYLKDVFGDEPLRLARDVRQELVAELSAQGMSTRAIAPIVGVDNKTVHNDLKRGVEVSTPEPVINVIAGTGEVIEGLDGKTYTRPERKAQSNPSAEVSLINDIRLYLRALARSPQIARLSDAGKQHIITALNDTIAQLEGNQK